MFIMVAENYYIERKDYHHRLFGLLGTVVLHGLILLLFYFIVLHPPDPPLEGQGKGGTELRLGDPDVGGPEQTPQPDQVSKEVYTPIEEKVEETPPVVSDDPESVAIEQKKQDKKVDKKMEQPLTDKKVTPQIDLPQKTVDAHALYHKKPNQGSGTGSETGIQGGPDGVPGGAPDGNGGTGGIGPGGPGIGDGIGEGDKGNDKVGIELSGRKVQELPNIEDHSKAVGKVVVSIIVNREGKVIKAVPGQVGTTTTDESLMEKAKQGALKTRFNTKEDAPDEQRGTMTFIFRFKQ